jgi:molybdopterin-guanine dinucleotide biosynthesis protein A
MEHNQLSLQPNPQPVGVILAGGASRRMGREKARIRLGGITLAEHAVARLEAIAEPVILADRGQLDLPGVPSIPDGPGKGPAAGLLGAARAYPGRDLLVLACDLPQVPTDLLAHLATCPGGDLWLPRWRQGVEPLCALYRPTALAALDRQVAKGNFALRGLLRSEVLDPLFLEGKNLAFFGNAEELFLNLNTPQDLERWGLQD